MGFPTTSWTMLADATLDGDRRGRDALAELCAAYRRPVEAWLAVRGLPPADAEDTAQEFFARLLRSRAWKRADRSRGRFRSFLLGILNHVVQHSLRDGARLKRGGGLVPESLDELLENGIEPAEPPPDVAEFDRAWALTLTMDALRTVELEFAARGQREEFALLRQYLPGAHAPPPYESAAQSLGISIAALKAAVHRMRQRFREVLRTAVARTVSAPHEVDDELRHLGTILLSPSAFAQPAVPDGKYRRS